MIVPRSPGAEPNAGRDKPAAGRKTGAPRSSGVSRNSGLRGSSQSLGGAGPAQLLPTVRQQLVDPLRRVGADAIQHIAEVNLGEMPWADLVGPFGAESQSPVSLL